MSIFNRSPEQIIAREWARSFRRLMRATTRGPLNDREHAFQVLRWFTSAQPTDLAGVVRPVERPGQPGTTRDRESP